MYQFSFKKLDLKTNECSYRGKCQTWNMKFYELRVVTGSGQNPWPLWK